MMDQHKSSKSLKSVWNWYRQKVYDNCTGRSDADNTLEYWRNQLFAETVLYLIPLSLIVLIPGIYMAFVEQLVYLIVADTIAFVSMLIIAFAPRISIYLRKIVFCVALYLVSIALLFYLGTFGPGLMYLLAISVFVVLILDQRYGVGVVGLNVIVCVVLGVEVNINLLDSAALSNYELDSWVAVSSNLVFLSLLAVILIPKLFDGLKKSMEKQNRLRVELEKNQQKLEQSVKRIEEKNRKVSRSEENYRNLFDLSPLPMYVFDLETYKFLDVNKAAVKNYGYSKEEFLAKKIEEIRPPEEIPRLKEKVNELGYEEKIHEAGVFKHQRKNGDTILVDITTTNVDYEGITARVVIADDITEKKVNEDKLKQSLEEKKTLLAEIHHRVKNNLAVVSGLMQIQAFEEENEVVESKLLDSMSRIRTMASIHELLYESKSFSQINFSSMVKKLTKDITAAMKGDKEIKLEIFDEPIQLNINQAIPCAIMVNEVLTNAFKHAFKDRNKGKIEVSMEIHGEKVGVSVRDDGTGIDESKIKDTSSLGMHLIKILTQQIEGEYHYKNEGPGTRFTIEFIKKDVEGAASTLSI